jgi:starch phosphorylase
MKTQFHPYQLPYQPDSKYSKQVAYFSMEFAVHQSLKIYSGGLGFLAGSHMRSAHDLKQNLIGIGILWKYGYYDQVRRADQTMDVLFQEKIYGFLEDTQLKFQIEVNHHPVWVTAWYLAPEVFGTAPLFLLSTDLPENDYLSQTISHKLYDFNTEAKVAASILLGIGGATLLDIIGWTPEVYHLNEAHALPTAFYLYHKFKHSPNPKAEVRQRMVFTTHTPEEAGNQRTDIRLLEKMSFFDGVSVEEVRQATGIQSDTFDHSLAALRLSKKANGVSKMHGEVARHMWGRYEDMPPIIHVTNAQHKDYWTDKPLENALLSGDDEALVKRKKEMKRLLFEEVADQTGEIYDENVLTVVWARRFAAYKRADLVLQNLDRFHYLLTQQQYPIQFIWAGKPYPFDHEAISVYNRLVHESKKYFNFSVLVGYELKLSKLLKQGADVWLNNPRLTREASGTSGMTAAMNGAVNLSVPDGWIPEFARHGMNSFVIQPADINKSIHLQDDEDEDNIMELLQHTILPMYYDRPQEWLTIVKNSMQDIVPFFDSHRMADEYYQLLYPTQD